LTSEELKQVEDLVNEKIEKEIPVQVEEMTVDEARKVWRSGYSTQNTGKSKSLFGRGI
jgi:alanyl-tRNA synthetase